MPGEALILVIRAQVGIERCPNCRHGIGNMLDQRDPVLTGAVRSDDMSRTPGNRFSGENFCRSLGIVEPLDRLQPAKNMRQLACVCNTSECIAQVGEPDMPGSMAGLGWEMTGELRQKCCRFRWISRTRLQRQVHQPPMFRGIWPSDLVRTFLTAASATACRWFVAIGKVHGSPNPRQLRKNLGPRRGAIIPFQQHIRLNGKFGYDGAQKAQDAIADAFHVSVDILSVSIQGESSHMERRNPTKIEAIEVVLRIELVVVAVNEKVVHVEYHAATGTLAQLHEEVPLPQQQLTVADQVRDILKIEPHAARLLYCLDVSADQFTRAGIEKWRNKIFQMQIACRSKGKMIRHGVRSVTMAEPCNVVDLIRVQLS
ncbi:MAG TPA: hypothetical protein VIL88_03535 [Devosia sp.]